MRRAGSWVRMVRREVAGGVGSGVRHRLSILSGLEAAAGGHPGARTRAGVAQMEEQPPCKRQVGGSIPPAGSIRARVGDRGSGAPSHRHAGRLCHRAARVRAGRAVRCARGAPHRHPHSPCLAGRPAGRERPRGHRRPAAAASAWTARCESPGGAIEPGCGAAAPGGSARSCTMCRPARRR